MVEKRKSWIFSAFFDKIERIEISGKAVNMVNHRPLNEKQKRFADQFVILGNASKAAVAAGYSDKYANTSANKLLQRATVKEYIENRLKELDSERVADQQEVMEYLTAVMRGEHKDETLRLVGEGVQDISDIAVTAKDRVKAAELLGKRYRMWTDRIEADVKAEAFVPIQIINDSGVDLLGDEDEN